MKTKYRYMFGKLEEVSIKSETTAYVTKLNGSRDKKKTSYCNYFDTLEEAHDFIIESIESERDEAYSRIARLTKSVDDLNLKLDMLTIESLIKELKK